MFRRMAQRKTLLLIDDDDDLRGALAGQLALHEEFAVNEAASAGEGVKLSRELKPDLILLDVDLPDMDGREACRLMRKNGVTAPVIMLTAAASDSDTILGLESGLARQRPDLRRPQGQTVVVTAATAGAQVARGPGRWQPGQQRQPVVGLDQAPAVGHREVHRTAGLEHPRDLRQVQSLGGAVADVLDDVVGNHQVEARRIERQCGALDPPEYEALAHLAGVGDIDPDHREPTQIREVASHPAGAGTDV